MTLKKEHFACTLICTGCHLGTTTDLMKARLMASSYKDSSFPAQFTIREKDFHSLIIMK